MGHADPRARAMRPIDLLPLAAGLLLLSAVLLPHPEQQNETMLTAFGLAALVYAAVGLSGAWVPTTPAEHAVITTLSIPFNAAAIYFLHVPYPAFGLLFLWAVPQAYVYLPLRAALLQTAAVTVAYPAAVELGATGASDAPWGQDVVRTAFTVVTMLALGLLVRQLVLTARAGADSFRRGFDESVMGIVLLDDEGRIARANGAFARFLGRSADDLRGAAIRELTDPDDRELTDHVIAGELSGQAHGQTLEKRYRRPDGSVVWGRVHASSIETPGGGRQLFGQVEDISERKRAEERVAALVSVSRFALETADEHALVERVARATASALHVELAKVLEIERGGRQLRLRAGVGWDEGLVGRATVPVGLDSQAGYTLLTGGPVIVRNLGREGRFSGPPLLHRHGVVSGMSVVIAGSGAPWGVLGAHTRSPRGFSGEEADFLQAMADTLGAALQRLNAVRDLDERGQEVLHLAAARRRLLEQVSEAEQETRERIAQRIHDDPLQELLAARQDVLELELKDVGKRCPEIPRLKDALTRTTAQLREAVADLHPVVSQHLDLPASLRSLAARQARAAGLDIETDIASGLGDEQRPLIEAAVRELLANVAKHAGASRARLEVGVGASEVRIRVLDDGRGFQARAAADAVNEGHVGLASLTERIEGAGGRLSLRGRPEGGALVEVTLPRLPGARIGPPRPSRPRSAGEELRRLVDAMPQMVWIAAADGTVEHMNERARAYLASPTIADPGVPLPAHPEDAANVRAAWNRSVEAGTPFRARMRVPLRAGGYGSVRLAATAVRGRDGSVLRWVGTFEPADARQALSA